MASGAEERQELHQLARRRAVVGGVVERRLPGLGQRQRVARVRRPPRQHLGPGRGQLLPVAGDAHLARPHERPRLRQGQGQAAELLGQLRRRGALGRVVGAFPEQQRHGLGLGQHLQLERRRPCPPTPASAR